MPNGLVVGARPCSCRTGAAGTPASCFAAAAAGVLLGDITTGQFLPPAIRERMLTPLRLLLAVPYLGCLQRKQPAERLSPQPTDCWHVMHLPIACRP